MKFEGNEETNIYCVDCKSWTRQIFRRVMPDNTLLFLCKECGCENSIPIEEDKD